MSELQEYKCPNCGATIRFDSESQKMRCPSCSSLFEVETLKKYDEQLKEENNIHNNIDWSNEHHETYNDDDVDHMKHYVCNSCGGEIITDFSTAATSCPYCGNHVVMMSQLKGNLKPDLVIPFKLDKQAAKEKLKEHLKGKAFLPKNFANEAHIDEIKGVYVPFWLFSADAKANMKFSATRKRSYTAGDYYVTDTYNYMVFRSGNLSFNFVPTDGSTKFDDELMQSIEPFDYSQAVDFQSAYLAGYLADKYDVDSQTCQQIVNARIRTSIETTLSSTVLGYDSVFPISSNVNVKNGTVKYALLPVWILTSKNNGKRFMFAMNGQTGKLVGDLPVDMSKFFALFFIILIAVAALVFGVCYLIWLL